MTRHYVWLFLAMFLVAALICLSPGSLHCDQAGTCQLLAGVSTVLAVVWTGATAVVLAEKTRRFRLALVNGSSSFTAYRPTTLRSHSNTSLQSSLRVFLL